MPTDSAPPKNRARTAIAASRGGLDPEQREELGRIFQEQHHALVSYLTPMLQSTQEAKDVAQEAYLRILDRPESETISFLRGYLFRTARNLASNRRDQMGRREEIDRLVWIDTGDTAQSPEQHYSNQTELRVIIQALTELPEQVAKAFVLVKIEGMSIEEAAQKIGCNGRNVYRYLERALEHFRSLLQPDDAKNTDKKPGGA